MEEPPDVTFVSPQPPPSPGSQVITVVAARISRGAHLFTPIYYFLPFPVSEDLPETPFARFSFGLCAHLPLLYSLPNLPACVEELTCSKLMLRWIRTSGLAGYSAIPLEIQFLSEVTIAEQRPFVVVFSSEQTFSQVDAWATTQRIRPLHVSDAVNKRALHISRLRRKHIRSHVQRCLRLVPNAKGAQLGTEAWTKKKGISYPRTSHNTSIPNEGALCSLGLAFTTTSFIPVPGGDGENGRYEEAMVRSAKHLRSLRVESDELYFPSTPDLMLISPVADNDLFKQILENQKYRRTAEGRRLRQAVISLRDQRNYYHLADSDFAMELLRSGSLVQQIQNIRTDELRALTIGAQLRAASDATPTYRMLPTPSSCKSAYRHVADCYRASAGEAKAHKKMRGLLDKLNVELLAASGACVTSLMRDSTAVRLVTDLPLEWVENDGLPLMFTRDVSRINPLPGNLMLQQLVPKHPLFLRTEDFAHILVVRSFDENDPSRAMLSNALQAFAGVSGTQADIVDVVSLDELRSAMNNFSGAMMVFDGHGTHKEFGKIGLGQENTDVWSIRGTVRCPPIVMLSSCDTNPFDRNYATVANGFLGLGARCVIGSALPIQSDKAALFAARLVYAATGMVNAVRSSGETPVRWSSLFSRVLRSQLMVEVIRHLEMLHPNVKREDVKQAQIRITTAITMRHPAWYSYAMEELGKVFSMRMQDVISLHREELPLPQSMLYLHLGDPESILIGSPVDMPAAGLES